MTTDPALDALQAQRRAVIRWLRPLAPLILAVVAVSAFTSSPRPGWHDRGLAVTVTLAVVLLSGLAAVLLADRAVLVLVLVLLASSAVLAWLQPSGAGIAGVFVGLSLLAPMFRGHRSVPLIIVATVLLAVTFASGRHDSIISALLTAIMIAAFYGMLLLAIRLSDANRRTQRLLAELAASRDAQAQAAKLGERQRLAREMHDVLAHSLSGLILQLEGARMLAADNPADPRLPAAVERAHQLGRSGLEEARRAIGTLRDEELPGPERLAELARQFEEDRGVSCTVTVTGEPRPLGSSEARLALYRVAQEALTNVARHATGTSSVAITLAYSRSSARLTVEDVGLEPDKPGDGGYGLTGMRERAELLGGRLTAEPTGHGFRVELEVPA
ncbi:sensor histidine kinase [Actinoplanes sp. NPDC051411]|uniref:sensor histidine kinase n=1 Tax=Actinoplanes sp. NPDC051411 TaxID=3155522 RepID=UPI003413960F